MTDLDHSNIFGADFDLFDFLELNIVTWYGNNYFSELFGQTGNNNVNKMSIVYKCQQNCHVFEPLRGCWREIMFQYLNDRNC